MLRRWCETMPDTTYAYIYIYIIVRLFLCIKDIMSAYAWKEEKLSLMRRVKSIKNMKHIKIKLSKMKVRGQCWIKGLMTFQINRYFWQRLVVSCLRYCSCNKLFKFHRFWSDPMEEWLPWWDVRGACKPCPRWLFTLSGDVHHARDKHFRKRWDIRLISCHIHLRSCSCSHLFFLIWITRISTILQDRYTSIINENT